MASPKDLIAKRVALCTSRVWMVDFRTFRLRASQDSTLLRSLMRLSSSSISKEGIALFKPAIPGAMPGIKDEPA
jgi:hypothetical protein